MNNSLLLRNIINVPGDMIIFCVDTDYRYITFNYNYEKYLKETFNIEISEGDSILEIFKDYRDINKEKSNFDRTFQGIEYSQIGNYTFKGQKYYYKDIYKPFFNNDNKVEGAIVYYTNITNRKHSEKTWEVLLNISEKVSSSQNLTQFIKYIRKELSKIIKTTNFFVALYDDKSRTYSFPYFIDKYDKIDEFSTYELKKSITDYVRRTGKPLKLNKLQEKELFKKGLIDLIGTTSPSWLGVPLKVDKKTIGVLVVQDYERDNIYTQKDVELMEFVSGHIATAIQRKQTEKALLINTDQLQNALRIAKMGHFVVNVNAKKVILSPEIIELLEIDSGKEVISLKELKSYVHKEDQNIFSEILTKKPNETNISEIDLKIIKNKTKELIYAHIKYKGQYNLKGDLVSVKVTIQDQTKQNIAKQELKKAKEKAEESDKLKSAFLANMSHEIRTPMNAIVGFSKLMKKPKLAKKDQINYANYINSSANNLLKLINDIIDVAKIEAGQLSIVYKPADINKILDELHVSFEQQREQYNKKHIKIFLNKGVDTDSFIINTDPVRFQQIMINLLGNALKFIDKGFIEFGYTVVNDKLLQFYVEDTGYGIPKDKKHIIFNRFGQIIDDKVIHPGGTGLGLSITRHLVKLLGGYISFDSEVNKGSKFFFTLPYKSVRKMLVDEPDKIKADLSELQNIKILIVEDNEVNRILIEDIIQGNTENNTIIFAETGNQAIKISNNEKFDVIFMDIKLPDIDGYEVTKHIRAKSINKDVPVIGLSAHAIKEFKEKSIETGMNDFISKPFSFDEIFGALSKYTKVKTNNKKQPEKKENPIKETTENKPEKKENNYKHIDLSILNTLYKNDENKLKNILNMYLKNIKDFIQKLDKAIKNNEQEQIKHAAHSLKSALKYIGMEEAAKMTIDIESNANNNDKVLKEKFETIKDLWEPAQKELKELIN